MSMKRLLCMGNSVSGGAFCTSPEFSYQAQFLKMVRAAEPSTDWFEIAPLPSGSHAYTGGIWALWNSAYRRTNPDVFILGGVGDNDAISGSTVASLALACSMESQTLKFNANITANHAYIITDGTNEEVVIPQTASTVTGTRCIRGAMGTEPRSWPVSSVVHPVASKSTYAWKRTLELFLRDILQVGDRRPIVLIGGQVFEATTGAGAVATEELVDDLQKEFPNVEYCPYETEAGDSLFAASAYTDYCGPAALVGEDGMADDALTVVVDDATDIDPGDYIGIVQTTQTTWATRNAAPTHATTEFMLVASKDGNTITVEGAEERAKLGSSATNLAFTENDRVCKICTTRLDPRYAWASLGAAGDFNAEGLAYDMHPNNRGYLEIAKSFYRGYQRALGRV